MRLCLCILFITFLLPATAQEIMRGLVVDSATFNHLPFVNIQLKNKGRGTMTDEKGSFSIAASRNDTLVFSLVGYHRLEMPLNDYEASMIRLTEKYTLLETVTIHELRQGENPYEGMFEDQNAALKKSIPFYLSKAKKEKIKFQSLKEENMRVKTYVDVVINNSDTKGSLMKKHHLQEHEYYAVLREFNEKHYRIMYYLTPAELISLLNSFFENHSPKK